MIQTFDVIKPCWLDIFKELKPSSLNGETRIGLQLPLIDSGAGGAGAIYLEGLCFVTPKRIFFSSNSYVA